MKEPKKPSLVKRSLISVVAATLVAVIVQPGPVAPTIDLSTPEAIQLAAFTGKLEGFMSTKPVIKGEATTPGHEGEIEINSILVALSNDADAGSGGGSGGGRAELAPIRLTKSLDKASVKLAERVFLSNRLDGVLIMFDTPSPKGGTRRVLTYSLADAVVQTHRTQIAGTAGEAFTLDAAKITIKYFPTNSKGESLAPVETCFDFVENVVCNPA